MSPISSSSVQQHNFEDLQKEYQEKQQANFDKGSTLMEIGEHCTICNQLDFLPFKCNDCNKFFCSEHLERLKDHDCIGGTNGKEKLKQKEGNIKLNSVSALFPDRRTENGNGNGNGKFTVKTHDEKKKISILSQMEAKSNNEDSLGKLALLKLKSFLKQQRSTSTNSTSSSKMFMKKLTPSSKIVQASTLKSTAKGDQKIPTTERIYIYVQYVPSSTTSYPDTKQREPEKLEKLPIFVSRAWPIGRLLDYASFYLKIKNENNKTNDPERKLTIFREPRQQEIKNSITDPQFIPANGRVHNEVKDCDTLYLVRGLTYHSSSSSSSSSC
ncbi:hypothetical protein PACTADRAFT_51913 [Pachysolen tannophilus NRRL Y-2460]|uniref:AN1-type domain-containing protein n=1 Tax=Pachysolen tannophilus NRRL Y-2460 TaxID=669874 RepID=A0A1E4TNH4_PACTA|nr:hypothetical protein PACTADRAFT_51913 [Pachysolen tannophilus NRRL Y-2460]